MRKETSAGVIAGAISGGILGFFVGAFSIFAYMGMLGLEARFKQNPMLAPNAYAILLLTEVLLLLMYVAFGSFFGIISGFIFVKAVNRLPFHSTYVKAILPWIVVLIAFAVVLGNSSVMALARLGLESFIGLVAVAAAALLFAFLFDRWKSDQQVLVANQPP